MDEERESFLGIFYPQFMKQLISILFENQKEATAICGLLAYCIQHHGYHFKYFILRNSVTPKIIKLVRHTEKFIALSAVRFLRAMIGTKDRFYYRHINKFNLFEPFMEIFQNTGSRYNLLNSAMLDVFEFIRKENIKTLIDHLVGKYEDFFKSITYVETFRQLILKSEQNRQKPNFSPANNVTNMIQRRFAESDDEENYFRESDIEEELQQSQSSSPSIQLTQFNGITTSSFVSLVPYYDEENDNDNHDEKFIFPPHQAEKQKKNKNKQDNENKTSSEISPFQSTSEKNEIEKKKETRKEEHEKC